MLKTLSYSWWLYVIRALIAILFGTVLVTIPFKTLAVVSMFLGLYLFVEGVITVIITLIRAKDIESWGIVLGQGIVMAIIGAGIFTLPLVSIQILIFLFALCFLVLGIFQIVMAVHIRKYVVGEWFLAASGIIMLIFSLLLFTKPAVTVAFLSVLLGVGIVIWGIFLMAFAFELRSIRKDIVRLKQGELIVLSSME